MVYSNDEMTFIEYGRNEVLAVCRTAHMQYYLISVTAQASKKAATATALACCSSLFCTRCAMPIPSETAAHATSSCSIQALGGTWALNLLHMRPWRS